MNWQVFGIAVYVFMMIGLGVFFSHKIENDSDYYLAGRSLGPGLATFSIFATWFGAETCIGTAGAVYSKGLTSVHADPLGYSLCLLIMAVFFAKRLWQKQITTIPDLLRKRYSPSTEKIAALIMIPSSLIWAGAQVRALGQILHATTDFGPLVAVTVAASVVIIYTMFGGMLADAYADLIQGMAIISGLLFLLMGQIELWPVPVFGSLMAQELVSRVSAGRSEKIA
jgi:SSS family solute:Na+ symporter